jgi:hypothetical protein
VYYLKIEEEKNGKMKRNPTLNGDELRCFGNI